MKTNKKIAKITSTMLGFEDHGILTVLVDLDFGGWRQSIGGYALSKGSLHDSMISGEPRELETMPLAMDFVVGVMRAAGVNRWESMTGRTIYVIYEGDEPRMNARPIGIEPLPTEKGERFMFADWQKRVEAAL